MRHMTYIVFMGEPSTKYKLGFGIQRVAIPHGSILRHAHPPKRPDTSGSKLLVPCFCKGSTPEITTKKVRCASCSNSAPLGISGVHEQITRILTNPYSSFPKKLYKVNIKPKPAGIVKFSSCVHLILGVRPTWSLLRSLCHTSLTGTPPPRNISHYFGGYMRIMEKKMETTIV